MTKSFDVIWMDLFFLTWDHLRGSVICFGCGKYPLPPFTPQPKVVRLVVVVVVAFFICWSPHQLLMARAIFATDHRVIEMTMRRLMLIILYLMLVRVCD